MKLNVIIGILFFLPGPGQFIVAQRMNQEIKLFLSKEYPAKATLAEGEFQYVGSSPIMQVHLNSINNCYNGLAFYKTKLQTAYFEFPEVEILIAVQAGKISNRQILKSLSFEPPGESFMKLFYGCYAQTAKDRQQLALMITNLLASVAVKPVIKMISAVDSPEVAYRISQANHSYIDFTFTFSEDEKLTAIGVRGN